MNTRGLIKIGSWRLIGAIILAVFILNLTSGVSADPRSEIPFSQHTTVLVDPTPQVEDNFGARAAISGDTIAVMDWSGDGAAIMNVIYIYRRHQGGTDQWGLVKQLYFDFFAAPFDLVGDILVVKNQVFYRNEGGAENWGLVHTFSILDPNYISSVAVSGSTIVLNHIEDPFLGVIQVHIYEKDQGGPDVWGEIAASPLTPGTAGDYFRAKFVLSDDLLAINASDTAEARLVYIFSRDEGGADQWGQVARLTSPDPELFSNFGSVMAFSDGRLAVQQSTKWQGLSNVGRVYIYQQRNNGTWHLATELLPPVPAVNLNFGDSLAFSGDMLYIGSDGEDLVWMFRRSSFDFEHWVLMPETLPLPADSAAWTVYADGDVVVVGSPWEPGPAGEYHMGAVHLWMGGGADLALDQTVSADETAPGTVLTYFLVVSNSGPSPAVDLEVKDYLPGHVTLQNVSGTGWVCDSADLEITCTSPGLAEGASTDPIIIEVLVGPNTGWINNLAAVTSYNLELDFANNQQVEMTSVVWPYTLYFPAVLR
jgi:uncharacterized repeat protein (TIGR01451 family)